VLGGLREFVLCLLMGLFVARSPVLSLACTWVLFLISLYLLVAFSGLTLPLLFVSFEPLQGINFPFFGMCILPIAALPAFSSSWNPREHGPVPLFSPHFGRARLCFRLFNPFASPGFLSIRRIYLRDTIVLLSLYFPFSIFFACLG